MHSSMAKALYILGAKKRNPTLWKQYEKLKNTEWLPEKKLLALQEERLQDFLAFAGTYSPYYKNLFAESDFDCSKFSSLSDFQKIPETSKFQLIRYNKSIHSDYEFRRCFLSETSGTSGSALEFNKNEEWDSINRASQMRSYDWYGVKPWDRYGYFWGYNIAPFQALKVKTLDALQNRVRLFQYDEKSIKRFAHKLRYAKYLSGYSSMIYEVARASNKLGLRAPNLKLVKGTSEMILDAYQPEVEKAFGTKIKSEYGAAESGLIAFECPAGKMHINVENVYVETDDNNEILVTNLVSHSFPIIRYRLGDVIKLSPITCSCGRSHPIIEEIAGRRGSVVKGTTRDYPALTFYYVFKNLAIHKNVLMNYKAIQDNIGVVDIYIENKNSSKHEKSLANELSKYFSDDIKFNIHYVDRFDNIKKKRQYFESTL